MQIICKHNNFFKIYYFNVYLSYKIVQNMSIRITGSGSYIPKLAVPNTEFAKNVFLNDNGSPINQSNEVVTEKLRQITGIEERRYADDNLVTSDIAFYAAERAIEDAGIDRETLDYIILAHNFGDVKKGTIQGDLVPSLASRVKHSLRIKNPKCEIGRAHV